MKSFYSLKLSNTGLAVIDLTDYYGLGKIITRINVPPEFRSQGHGSSLLKSVVKVADSELTTLFLEIQQSDGLSYSELESWYGRHGFMQWKGLYRRKPQQETLQMTKYVNDAHRGPSLTHAWVNNELRPNHAYGGKGTTVDG